MDRSASPASAPLRRRLLAAGLALAPMLLLGTRAQAAAPRRATPAQTEGPFYPVVHPDDADFDLLHNGSLAYPKGQPVWLVGSVSDLAGRPLAGAEVEIWQCDHDGHYRHPRERARADDRFQGFGRARVATDGSYRFRTMRPVAYGGRTPHIHVKVRQGARDLLTTQLYVEGDPGNPRDFLWSSLSAEDRAALTLAFAPVSDGLIARFPIFVAA